MDHWFTGVDSQGRVEWTIGLLEWTVREGLNGPLVYWSGQSGKG